MCNSSSPGQQVEPQISDFASVPFLASRWCYGISNFAPVPFVASRWLCRSLDLLHDPVSHPGDYFRVGLFYTLHSFFVAAHVVYMK